MTNPISSQAKNHAQLLLVIPVSKYKQVINPINGIKEYFFTNDNIDSATAVNQKIMRDILGVARSIKLLFPLI